MPEGDSLVQLAHQLQPIMQRQRILRSDFRTPHLATTNLAGWLIADVRAVAKYLFITVTQADRHLVVLSHLGMDGAWRVDARPYHGTRCILHLKDHTIVGHKLAQLEVLPPEQAQQLVAHLGPDMLDPAWSDPHRAHQLLHTAVKNFRNATDQPIATALLDQRLVAGIGNIYRCEVLFLARINPYRRVANLSDDGLAGLIILAQQLMVLNIAPRVEVGSPRRTVDVRPDAAAQFGVRIATRLEQARARTDARRNRRSPNFWVYGRQRHHCLRCQGPIALDQVGRTTTTERDVYWCPTCQQS